MRIAFFVPSFPELSETFVLRQVTGLLDRGHTVRLFARRAASGGAVHEAVDAYGLRSLVRVLPHREDAAPARLGGPGSAGAAARCARREHARALGGWATLARTLSALASEGAYDVVHCHYGDMGLRYRVAARLWSAPLVVSFYGFDASAYPKAHGPGVYGPLWRAAGAVASLGAHMDARLRRLGCPDARLCRVPLAVDPEAFGPPTRAPRRPGDPVRLLSVARLTEKKGVEYALRAVAALRGRFPAARYDVVGDGPLRGELESLAASLGLDGVARFHGARTGDFVREAMRGADLFVLPSVTAADGDEEGTPTVLLEAACAGLPVVATRHAGIPEVVRDGESGLLVPERDAEALAAALTRLLEAPERWEAMGRAGRRHVEGTHSTAAVAATLEAVYAGLLEAGRPAGRPATSGTRRSP